MKRGEVYLAELEPRSGSEQRGRRPVIILSNDLFNISPSWRTVIVVPLSTSGRQAARGPTAVPVPAGVSGLRHDSVALCHQVTTLDRAKLGACLGALAPATLAAVEAGLCVAMELLHRGPPPPSLP